MVPRGQTPWQPLGTPSGPPPQLKKRHAADYCDLMIVCTKKQGYGISTVTLWYVQAAFLRRHDSASPFLAASRSCENSGKGL